jgi:hypothetical protein
LKVATKLKWGYLTEEEAKSRGFDMDEWRKVKGQLAKAEKLFVSTLQGKAENFKRAILNGRAGKLSGFDTGLGVVVAAATAASTTAAVPFITKIIKLLKNINFKKLISKVAHSKVENEAAQADGDTPTEDGGTSIPENENPGTDDNGGGSEDADSAGGEDANSGSSSSGEDETTNGSDPDTPTAPANKNAPADNSGAENSNPDNLPATTNSNARVAAKTGDTSDTGEESFITKAVNWVKDNKAASVVITGTAAFLLYTMLKPKGLSGTPRRGTKKKGKAKTHPPHTISGIKKSAKRKSKAKPKGGSNRKFKL